MNPNALKVLARLKELHPGVAQFKRSLIHEAAQELGLDVKDYLPLLADAYRVHRGTYNLSSLLRPSPAPAETAAESSPTALKMANVASVVNTDCYVPSEDPTYVRWGQYNDVVQIVKSGFFYPIYIAGLSGNPTRLPEPAEGEEDAEQAGHERVDDPVLGAHAARDEGGEVRPVAIADREPHGDHANQRGALQHRFHESSNGEMASPAMWRPPSAGARGRRVPPEAPFSGESGVSSVRRRGGRSATGRTCGSR